MRAIFFDETSARAVVGKLRRDGYVAEPVRERLAGEDDDEDHPWAVLSDAPRLVLELYVDEYEGWLDEEPVPGGTAAAGNAIPLPLPAEPRRTGRRVQEPPERPDRDH